MVLYTSNGLQGASEAKKAISAFFATPSISVAYLQYNSKGNITGTHLFYEDHDQQIAAIDLFSGKEKPQQLTIKSEEATDALSLQLQALAFERQTVLNEIANEMIEQIKEDLEAPSSLFKENFGKLLKKYIDTSTSINDKISSRIVELEQEYAKVPLCDFLDKAEKYGLKK